MRTKLQNQEVGEKYLRIRKWIETQKSQYTKEFKQS